MKRILWLVIGFFGIVPVLFLARKPILESIGSFLVIQDDLKPADVIVVLSGSEERVREAASLYHTGFSEYVIMTGLSRDGKINLAEGMREQAIRLDVPEDVIILEPEAQHTIEHPVFVEPIMQERGFESAIVVSSPYHMRRSAILFDRAFKDSRVELIYHPVQESWFKVKYWWKDPHTRKTVRQEYMKMSVNIFGRRVSEFVDNAMSAVLEY